MVARNLWFLFDEVVHFIFHMSFQSGRGGGFLAINQQFDFMKFLCQFLQYVLLPLKKGLFLGIEIILTRREAKDSQPFWHNFT